MHGHACNYCKIKRPHIEGQIFEFLYLRRKLWQIATCKQGQAQRKKQHGYYSFQNHEEGEKEGDVSAFLYHREEERYDYTRHNVGYQCING